jgi:hypothetical protein
VTGSTPLCSETKRKLPALTTCEEGPKGFSMSAPVGTSCFAATMDQLRPPHQTRLKSLQVAPASPPQSLKGSNPGRVIPSRPRGKRLRGQPRGLLVPSLCRDGVPQDSGQCCLTDGEGGSGLSAESKSPGVTLELLHLENRTRTATGTGTRPSATCSGGLGHLPA